MLKSTIWALALAGAMGAATPALAGEDAKVAAEIMALARAQWAAEVAGKSPEEQMASVADDYTEFNPVYPVRLDGKAMAVRMATADTSSTTLFGDMENGKVQVYGDTAILSYNFVGVVRDKDGKITPSSAKSTRVYARQGGKWMLVHANFAPVSSGN